MSNFTIRPIHSDDDAALAAIIRSVMPEFGAIGSGKTSGAGAGAGAGRVADATGGGLLAAGPGFVAGFGAAAGFCPAPCDWVWASAASMMRSGLDDASAIFRPSARAARSASGIPGFATPSARRSSATRPTSRVSTSAAEHEVQGRRENQ